MATCVSCGKAVPENESRCPACGAALPSPIVQQVSAPAGPAAADVPAPSDGPASAPSVSGAATAPATAPAYSSLGDRMLAAVLDMLVLAAAFWALGMWIAPRFGGLTPEGFNLLGAPALVTIGLSVLVFLLYCVCLEWWFGATLGKFVVGAKVVGVDGGRIDFRRSLIRNLFRVIDGIGVYLVAAIAVLVTRRRQRLGDMAARTVVIRRDYPGPGRAIALLILVGLPVAAVAGTWSLRASPSRETGSGGSTSTTAGGSTAGGRGGETTAPVRPGLRDVVDGPFALSGLRFAAGENGPDRPDATFKAGDTPTLLFEVKGFASDETQKGRVRMTVDGRDPDGVPVNEPRETEVQPPATAKALKSWANVSLPDYVIPGEYQLGVTAADLVGNRKVIVSAPFRVEGASFEPSTSLVLRNVRLTEGEDGPPRGDPKYSAGSTVWMAFDVVGFRTGPDKTVRVQEHMTVTSTSGEKVLDGQVLDLNRQFFYVPRRLPITNHITLGQIPPGDYQAVLAVTDGFGDQRYEHVVRFTIRQ